MKNSMKSKAIDPTIYITHRVLFEEVKDELNGWLNPANGFIKAMVSIE